MEFNKFKIGDLITTYHSGIFVIINIEKRFYKTERDIPSYLRDSKKIGDESSPLLTYKQICLYNGNLPKKNIIKQCDASFCDYADNYINKEKDRIQKIKKIINNETATN